MEHRLASLPQAELGPYGGEVRDMSVSKEMGQTVRYAIKKERRTVRLIGILVTVGVIVMLMVAAANGVTVMVG
ncbi:hypothetical protein [Streptomyces ossamyceticus]|uniref:hypothetical protein n=1 Tax=Streptomyces ossamyceticus TaxID=249581 RepID=UPI003434F622